MSQDNILCLSRMLHWEKLVTFGLSGLYKFCPVLRQYQINLNWRAYKKKIKWTKCLGKHHDHEKQGYSWYVTDPRHPEETNIDWIKYNVSCWKCPQRKKKYIDRQTSRIQISLLAWLIFFVL